MDAASLLRTFGSLGAVLGLLLLALWATRRYDLRLPGAIAANGQRRLALVERVALDAKRSVALIRRDGFEHLILITPEGHQIVESKLEAPLSLAPVQAPAPGADFAQILSASNAAHDRPTIHGDASAALAAMLAQLTPVLSSLRSMLRQRSMLSGAGGTTFSARLPFRRSGRTVAHPDESAPAQSMTAKQNVVPDPVGKRARKRATAPARPGTAKNRTSNAKPTSERAPNHV